MESWIRGAVLIALVSCGITGHNAVAQDSSTLLADVVQPDIERRDIEEAEIDAENWEFGFYAGVLSFEDFGSNDVYGVRIAYHISEDWFAEANYGISKLQKSSSEKIAGFPPLLTDDERDLSYYNLNLGFNLLPGELFIGKWAFNSSFYFILGAGNTLFASDEYFTYNVGGGLRLFVTDWIAMHWDVRNHLMTHALFGEDKDIQNLETHLGVTLFF
ncbi:outer membrane beta-barrel domain-containing protein [Marinagarivorans algicola]|uniref:outer membrane beta-barrel domain-containing protein n=1 Tax=Marinagarivorans algicola TaxID=1513270 RepID=UPI0006B66761|nr:outer membrane beta-barrel domain-containing protein [Marinagarivorans algicola]